MDVRPAQPAELESLAQWVAGRQSTADSHIAYLSSEPAAIASELSELAGWPGDVRVVGEPGAVEGVLARETDDDIGRVWWWGPFAADDRVADALYRSWGDDRPPEEELAPDDRNDFVARFAGRHGFEAETASVVLVYEGPPVGGTRARAMRTDDTDLVVALHDLLFPGTHTPGAALVTGDDRILTWGAVGTVDGYVAFEREADGTGYIDFLGVAPGAQGRGVGRLLVESAVTDLLASGVSSVHLTVREDNAAARTLYARVGFVEERLLRPFRKGFALG